MTNLKKGWESQFIVRFEGKKYICQGMAEATNRLPPTVPNYNNPDDEGNYNFEMADNAIDENGTECIVTWIFNTADYDYDWENVAGVEYI